MMINDADGEEDEDYEEEKEDYEEDDDDDDDGGGGDDDDDDDEAGDAHSESNTWLKSAHELTAAVLCNYSLLC